MPEMTGFDVVTHLSHSDHFPAIIIVTAYDRYAIQAFDAGAVDYLLKPVSQERLKLSLERARRSLGSGLDRAEGLARLQEIAGAARGRRVSKVVGRSGSEHFLLNVDEIMWRFKRMES